MIKEIDLIDKNNIIKTLEDFVKRFAEDDMEKYKDLIEGVNYAIAEISVTKPKAKIFEEVENEESDDAISREAAINAMIKIEQDDIDQYGCEIPEGFDSSPAIEALNNLPSVVMAKVEIKVEGEDKE